MHYRGNKSHCIKEPVQSIRKGAFSIIPPRPVAAYIAYVCSPLSLSAHFIMDEHIFPQHEEKP